MHQKINLVFFVLLLVSFCTTTDTKKSVIEETFSTKIVSKFFHNQILIQVNIQSLENRDSKPKTAWALLDSGSTENLLLTEDSPSTKQVSWAEDKNSNMILEFQPWGSALPSDYEIILGAPFFRANCIQMDFGIPIAILPNHKKKCNFDKNQTNPIQTTSEWFIIPLEKKNGLYHLAVSIGEKKIDMALDTGSGMSSVSKTLCKESMKEIHSLTPIMDIHGIIQKRKQFKLNHPFLIEKIEFLPFSVLDSDEIWDNKIDYTSTIGVDFLQTFRVYIDFGSKILGIHRYEIIQGQDHSSNERRSG
jgi:hypothetical protein